jgi:hypothetical protein
MSRHLLITSAIMFAIAGPAFADCNKEIQSLDKAVIQAETGASSADTGIPATQHQEQVLAGAEQGNEGAGGAGQAEVPASPHQQQLLTEPAAGPSGEGDVASGQQPADLIAEARDMAKAGDEEGCMQKVAQAKNLLGID